MEELKPCPFCGYSVAWGDGAGKGYDSDNEERYSIVCPDCVQSSAVANSLNEVVKLWNTRKEQKLASSDGGNLQCPYCNPGSHCPNVKMNIDRKCNPVPCLIIRQNLTWGGCMVEDSLQEFEDWWSSQSDLYQYEGVNLAKKIWDTSRQQLKMEIRALNDILDYGESVGLKPEGVKMIRTRLRKLSE